MNNEHYKLSDESYKQSQSLCHNPNHDAILLCIMNSKVQWKCNPNVQVVFFPSKSLSYPGNMWNHFKARKIIPSGYTSEVNIERAIYLYAIMEDIKFDVDEAIETSILMNTMGKHNLRHPALIFELCKKAGVPFTPLEENIDPLTGIAVRKEEPHRNQQIPTAPRPNESESKEGAKDEEDVEPTMAQGSAQMMDNINVLFLEQTS